MSAMLDRMLATLELTRGDDGRLRALPLADADKRQVVFGGELLGQAIVAAGDAMPDKQIKSVQTIFARGVRAGEPVDITVDVLHEGRNLGSASVTFSQGDRLCARALVLLDVLEPDLVRHQPEMPAVDAPDARAAGPHPLAAPETLVVGDVDVNDPSNVTPAELRLWVRFAGAPTGKPNLARALLAYATDGWLIATAMLPHEGVGQSMAHREISTGVVSHALVFHGDPDPQAWALIDHESVYAGSGRCYGRANVFTEDGSLVASFTQEALLRHFPDGQDPRGRERTVF